MRFFLCFALFFSWLSAQSQTEIIFEIDHRLNGTSFNEGIEPTWSFEFEAENNLGHAFTLQRFDYYLSNFTIVHDGGQETFIEESFYILHSLEESELNFGTHEISHIEALKFHFGLDEIYNHGDPSTYPADHPLAHQGLFTMFWDWQSGYIFAGVHTHSDSDMAIFHFAGDENYTEMVVPLDADVSGDVWTLELTARIEETWRDINLEEDLNSMDDYFLENFTNHVFSYEGTLSVDDQNLSNVSVYPNPNSGSFQIQWGEADVLVDRVEIFDLSGKSVFLRSVEPNSQNLWIEGLSEGLYIVSLQSNGSVVSNQKIVCSGQAH